MEKNTKQPAGKLRLHEDVELPIDGLPVSIQRLINEVASKFRCPVEFVIAAVFSAVSTVIGKRVKTYDGVYRNPLILWFTLVANSGSNKTAPVKEIFKPLREINKSNYEVFKEEFRLWRADKERDEMNPPHMNQLIVDDLTEEARMTILQHSRTGVLAYQPEIKGFFDDLNRYVKSGAVSRVLRMFDGDYFVVNRKGELEPGLVNDAFMNVFGDIQPDLLRLTFGNELFVNNGLNQRFLFVMPDNIEFPDREIICLDQSIMNEWRDNIIRLYNEDFRFELLHILGNCSQSYNVYYNSLQRKKESSRDNGYLLSIFSKLQIQVQRLAGVVHMMMLFENSGYSCNISEQAMEYAVRCMNYFEANAIKVYEKIFDVSVRQEAPRTQKEIIRQFARDVAVKKQSAFAEGIGKDPAYISRILSDIPSK